LGGWNEPAAGVVVYSSTAVVDDLDVFFVELEACGITLAGDSAKAYQGTYVTSSCTRSLRFRNSGSYEYSLQNRAVIATLQNLRRVLDDTRIEVA
jgi:hypothetical protein